MTCLSQTRQTSIAWEPSCSRGLSQPVERRHLIRVEGEAEENIRCHLWVWTCYKETCVQGLFILREEGQGYNTLGGLLAWTPARTMALMWSPGQLRRPMCLSPKKSYRSCELCLCRSETRADWESFSDEFIWVVLDNRADNSSRPKSGWFWQSSQ